MRNYFHKRSEPELLEPGLVVRVNCYRGTIQGHERTPTGAILYHVKVHRIRKYHKVNDTSIPSDREVIRIFRDEFKTLTEIESEKD